MEIEKPHGNSVDFRKNLSGIVNYERQANNNFTQNNSNIYSQNQQPYNDYNQSQQVFQNYQQNNNQNPIFKSNNFFSNNQQPQNQNQIFNQTNRSNQNIQLQQPTNNRPVNGTHNNYMQQNIQQNQVPRQNNL